MSKMNLPVPFLYFASPFYLECLSFVVSVEEVVHMQDICLSCPSVCIEIGDCPRFGKQNFAD